MNEILLFVTILIQFTSCSLEQSKPVYEKSVAHIDQKGSSIALKFTKGIRSIFQDSQGNYWLGSNEEGVVQWDGKSFKYLTTEEGLADNQIFAIQEDSNGRIWIQTANGISSYDGQSIINHEINKSQDAQKKWTKTDNDLWFNAGNKEGIFRYDGEKIDYLAFPRPKIINPDNVYFVTGIAKGKNGMLWMATYAGVYGYDGQEFTIINDETLGLKEETGELHVRCILEDSKGRLWIGNNGIGVLLKEKDVITNFSEQKNLIHPTSLNRPTTKRGDQSPAGTLEHVFAMEEDEDGNIWFADRDTGLWRYDGHRIKHLINHLEATNDFAHTIYKDIDGKLWFLMTNGSVFKFDGKTFAKSF